MDRVQKLEEMLLQSPHDCFLLHALGLEYVKNNELEKAILFFKQVLIQDEKYVGTYYHLAKTYEKQFEIEKAIETYSKGIIIARQLNDKHAASELQMALDDITDD